MLSKQIDEPLDMTTHLPFRIAVVSNLLALNRDWKIKKICDLEPREMRVLLNIGSYMPIKAADIAYQSRIDSYNVSRAVKKLEQKSLIEITPDVNNKNIKILVLNEKGKTLYQELKRVMLKRAQELESILSDKEQELLFDILTKIEIKTEKLLAEQALDMINFGMEAPADQKELVRWYRKGKSNE